MAVLMIGVLAACGEAASSSDTGAPVFDTDNGKARVALLQNYRNDDSVNQVLMISHTTGSDAKAYFYEKTEVNNAWVIVGQYDVYVGRNGMGKTAEGDAKSPCGDYEAVDAFGILPNPGTALNYIDIKPTTYACDEDCEFYNQIIDVEETGHDCTGEAMFDYSPQYNYGFSINFNSENKYPDGSAILIHCKGPNPYTGGCVAFDQEDMISILKMAKPGLHVYMDEYYTVSE